MASTPGNGAHELRTEKADLHPMAPQSLPVMPPVGIGGVEDFGLVAAGERDRHELAIVVVERGESRVVGKFLEASPLGNGCDRHLTAMFRVPLVIPQPFEERVP